MLGMQIPCRASWVLIAWMSSATSGCVVGGDDGSEAGDEAAVDEAGTAAAETGSMACFTAPQCDPLAPSCPGTDRCGLVGIGFECTPIPDGSPALGVGEVCANAVGCDEGLVCGATADCLGGQSCCVALCDLAQAQCAAGQMCTPYSASPAACYEDVGVCVPAV